jgi:WD40 repeat protein
MNLAFRKDKPKKNILFFNFTIDKRNIILGTTRGFRVYRIGRGKPILTLNQEFDAADEDLNSLLGKPGGISALDFCEGSNLLFLVGGGKYPKFNANKLLIWDCMNQEPLSEIEFNSTVRSVRSCLGRLVVIFVTKVVVYQTIPLRKLYEFDMYWNEHSIFDISTNGGDVRVVAFPARNKGQIDIAEINGGWSVQNDILPFTCRITGHSTTISALALTCDGNFLASASTNGTIIRVWNSRTGALQKEFRRGADTADIYSIAFDPIISRLAVISDKNTLHIFNLGKSDLSKRNRNSVLANIPYLPKYFSSDWSFKSFNIPSLKRSLIMFPIENPENDNEIGLFYNSVCLLSADGSISAYQIESQNNGKLIYYYQFYE